MGIRSDKNAKAVLGELIQGERPCVNCNYDLNGLRTGQKCPECGTVIKGGSRARRSDNLTDAPMSYLKSLRIGALLMAGGSVGACLLTFFTLATSNVLLALAALAFAGAWWAGVWIVTAPERHNPAAGPAVQDPKILRVVNRTLQTGWVLATLLLVVACFVRLSAVQARAAAVGSLNSANPFFSLSSLAGNLESIYSLFLIPFCLLTLVPMALHIGRLAKWAEDDELKTRMDLIAWGLAIGVPVGCYGRAIAEHMPSVLALLFTVGRVFGLIGLILSWGAFIWGMLTLASIAAWAVNNAVTRLETESRLAEKLAQHYESLAPDVEKLGKGGQKIKAVSLPGEKRIEASEEGPIPLAEPEGPPKTIKRG